MYIRQKWRQLSDIIPSKEMWNKNREKLDKYILWSDYVRQNGAWRRSTQKIFKGNERRTLHSSKLTENFQVIVLKALRILNVNWELTLEKKFDFIACVQCFWMMYSNLCLSFRETVLLKNTLPFSVFLL